MAFGDIAGIIQSEGQQRDAATLNVAGMLRNISEQRNARRAQQVAQSIQLRAQKKAERKARKERNTQLAIKIVSSLFFAGLTAPGGAAPLADVSVGTGLAGAGGASTVGVGNLALQASQTGPLPF